MAKLMAVQNMQRDIGIEQQYKLGVVKAEIMSLTSKLAEKTNENLNAQTDALSNLSARLDDIQLRHTAALEQIQVLESLYFVEIRRRFDQIPDAEQRTNEWIYDPTQTTFASWLESTDPNDGLFYVFGKVSHAVQPNESLTYAMMIGRKWQIHPDEAYFRSTRNRAAPEEVGR